MVTFTCTPFAGNPIVHTVTVSAEGANQSASWTCTDPAGNHVTGTFTGINIDKTLPALTGQAQPAASASGWYRGPVRVAFQCTDSLSGAANRYPTGNTTIASDTKGALVAGTCRDLAGNSVSLNVGPVKVDTTPPLVNIISPLNNFTYPLNSTVLATYNCLDALSGIASCLGSVGRGQRLDTSATGGPYTFTVTAVDLAGNQTQVTRTYFVR